MKKIITILAIVCFIFSTTGCVTTTTAADKKPAPAQTTQAQQPYPAIQAIDTLIKHYQKRGIELEKTPEVEEYRAIITKLRNLVAEKQVLMGVGKEGKKK